MEKLKACTKYFYNHPEDDSEYIICKDDDGYLVTKPDQSNDAHGSGYTLDEIEEMYGLDDFYDEEECDGSCDENK